MILRIVAALLPGAILAGCAAPPGQCVARSVVDLPLLAGSRMPAVEATLNGERVALLIDTGAVASVVAPEAADRFNLQSRSDDRYATMRGIGGTVLAPIVTIHSLMLGHGMARDIELPIGTNLRGRLQGMPVLGLFGADFLSNYDVDIDMPHHHFAIYALQGCAGVPPFAPPYDEVPVHVDATKVEVPVALDDVPLTAVLDSGSSLTTITPDDALRAGVTEGLLRSDPAIHMIGVDATGVPGRVHRFASLQIGGERLRNFPFVVAPMATGVTLLGDDLLSFNRVWISYRQQRLYVQPAPRLLVRPRPIP